MITPESFVKVPVPLTRDNDPSVLSDSVIMSFWLSDGTFWSRPGIMAIIPTLRPEIYLTVGRRETRLFTIHSQYGILDNEDNVTRLETLV